MPIYEYRCTSCGHELEALQKLSDAPLRECPACHQADLRKLVSAAGFQLKGSGWYATDFRNSGAKQPAKDAAPKVNGGSGGDAAKADGKPAETKASDSGSAGAAKSGAGESTAATTTSKSEN
jgi:putative FmdB family regulatory protein